MAHPVQPTRPLRPASVAGPSAAPSERTITTAESSDHSTIISTKILKVNTPDKYSGECGKLDEFLLQCDLYLSFNSNQISEDTDKVLYVTTYLRGKAQQWIRLYLKDWLDNIMDNQNSIIMALFTLYANFQKNMTTLFGEINKQHKAQIDMKALKQKGSAANYSAEFQRLSFYIGYDDEALKRSFYKGLKDKVKDELSRIDELQNLTYLAKTSIKIDERQYQRRMEKQGRMPLHFRSSMNKSGKSNTKKPYYGPMPMEVDVMQKKEPCTNQKSKGNYYNYSKSGHIIRQCRSPRKFSGKKQEQQPHTIAATLQEQQDRKLSADEQKRKHNAISWTACYDDMCYTHLSDKESSGWYPSAPKGRTICATIADCGYNSEYEEEEDPSWDLKETGEDKDSPPESVRFISEVELKGSLRIQMDLRLNKLMKHLEQDFPILFEHQRTKSLRDRILRDFWTIIDKFFEELDASLCTA